MSSSKKLTCTGTFAAGVYLSEAQNPRSPPYTLYTWIQYTVLIHTGKGGGRIVEPERRLERQQFTKQGRKYQHNWLYLQAINSDKHLPQSSFIKKFFRWRHFALVSILDSCLVQEMQLFPPLFPSIHPSLRCCKSIQTTKKQKARWPTLIGVLPRGESYLHWRLMQPLVLCGK